MKSLRRHGINVASEATSRLFSEPWKYRSLVSTESAAAPACANSVAKSATRKSARINPLDGEAFFSSAIIAAPDLDTRSRLARKPLGVRRAAASDKLPWAAVDFAADTRSRVAAMISSSLVGMGCEKYNCLTAFEGLAAVGVTPLIPPRFADCSPLLAAYNQGALDD